MSSTSSARVLSPKRNTTDAQDISQLVAEQLQHFGIDADTDYGKALGSVANNLYHAQDNLSQLWEITQQTLASLPKSDRIAYFNAKKFLSFQLAKLLDNLQNPFRATYQSLNNKTQGTHHYPLFDNVTALFSATPVVVRTATYVYACTEWVDDAFQGKEFTHQIYSRLLNPTNISLANAIVDMEAGEHSANYLAWNYNSGMAAIDGLLSNVLHHGDILIVSRNVYGGVYQLLHDYMARKNRLDIQLVWFDGYSAQDFDKCMATMKAEYADRIAKGAKWHVYMESPCNPHGYVLDVPEITRMAHAENALVMLDSTLATPVLHKPLQHKDPSARPDYIVHSYTKDICGSGATTAGVVIGEAHRMFQPKGTSMKGVDWSETMFWDVYYIKGAFLDSEKAFDVLNGMKTLPQRMVSKVINTRVFTAFLHSHPAFRVNSHAIPTHENTGLVEKQHVHGWPSALFTVDMANVDIGRQAFTQFFDALEPAFGHQVSIGQTNTIILCPALTSHSELSREEQQRAGIELTTMRIAMGTDDVKNLMAHFMLTAKIHIDPVSPGFSDQFMKAEEVDDLYARVHEQVHQQLVSQQPSMSDYLSGNH
ncbi:Cys/Met metabolism pyridoxal-phosphate-dependent enzyme [Alteromonas sediminis]|uniref:Cys/Met metabolism pyridoxal-phosphate-dependent enzyme n=1 Tax=Alteromonas sediminis TaxID=2259342 RepID=A0A3N5Z9A7_9ALTE|nr:aminotransferase class I/II-fold pyridoxal phosphate-dependent enzyme [Alteromonas sediminis]RPJ65768.1 Cys/Met metabolism pyridoxal-phosphate-dependent enzyme [Alteromonas sediminis]